MWTMTVLLRPYQKHAAQAAIDHFRASDEPCCIVLPTGAGKSLVIAELARRANGRVLAVAHVKELCEQNHKKFLALGASAGIYSAGLGQKDLSEQITFASIQSIARNLQEILEPISLLIIDECHRVSGEDSSQYGKLITHLRDRNPHLKTLGLTATPYRLGTGWCYRNHIQRKIARTEECRPFERCIYEVSLREMIDAGYLTQPLLEDAPIAQYDFSSLETDRFGRVPERSVNELLVRHKRVTRAIVEQIVEITSREKRRGIMIFASTVEHAREIQSYLPPSESALILGETEQDRRDEAIRSFAHQDLRYLVNVSVLTTGFDAPHVDFIALLRKTESVSLFQQIVGRGLRLSPGKTNCLIVDYAGNGYDLYSPEVGAEKPNSSSVPVTVPCPECSFENEFWGVIDEEQRVVEHYGRRCHGLLENADGQRHRCVYRFRFKECEKCGAENDIAARGCQSCGNRLVDPDELLKKALHLKDALVLRVSGMELLDEDPKLKLVYHDEDGAQVSERFNLSNKQERAVFNGIFSRRLASGRSPLELEKPSQAIQLRALIPIPDFVVARSQKIKGGRAKWWKVKQRVFDYEGRFRKADDK